MVKDCQITQGPTLQQKGVCDLIWSVKVPLKISTFVWKLMLDRLPTMLSLFNRGISSLNLCPFGNEESDSTTHLFLLCPLTRACWHGSSLVVHSSDFANITIQRWLTSLLLRHKKKEVHSMEYLQAVFTYLWSIWTYRNRVVHEETDPNPMDVILTAQALSYRYKVASNHQSLYNKNLGRPKLMQQSVASPWQNILIITGARCNRTKKCSFAYEAINMQGVSVFFGVASSVARSKGGQCLK